MKNLHLIICFFTLFGVNFHCNSIENEIKNPIMGYWQVDNEKIINEVQKLKDFPNKEKLISCFKKRFCGDYILYFSDDFYFSQLYRGEGVDDKDIFYNSGTIKFKVSESNDEQTILLNNHNEIIFDVIFNEKTDQFKTKVNGYYQYYKKVKPIESNKIVKG